METAPTYLVVIDQSAESRIALRFAALRAGHVGARLALVHVVAPPEFMQWGGVQEAMAGLGVGRAVFVPSAPLEK